MTPQEIAEMITARFGEKILETDLETHDAYCLVEPMAMEDVALFCRDELGFNYLRCLSGVDYLDKKKTTDDLGVVYHLGAIPDDSLTREDPKVASVENVWRTADWHEREAWDMYGIEFVGHHNLTRILCAEDWEGHALRKDYQSPDTYHGIKNNVV